MEPEVKEEMRRLMREVFATNPLILPRPPKITWKVWQYPTDALLWQLKWLGMYKSDKWCIEPVTGSDPIRGVYAWLEVRMIPYPKHVLHFMGPAIRRADQRQSELSYGPAERESLRRARSLRGRWATFKRNLELWHTSRRIRNMTRKVK